MARSSSIEYYKEKWRSMVFLPEWEARIAKAVTLIEKNDALYAEVSQETGIPKWFFGVVHYREGSCNPKAQILNGQDFRQKTTIVPIGVGPFASWAQAALLAVDEGGWREIPKWTLSAALQLLERHNGLGYKYRDLDSPYIFRGSNHCVNVGKFVKDGKYEAGAKDEQAGCACILKKMFPNVN